MGTGASVEKEPDCPYHRLRAAQIKKARNGRYVEGEASDFYRHCANGDIDQVRTILESPNRESIDKLMKLERNGDTALHVATEKGHVEIVKLLLEHDCSRSILNRDGRVAAEVANTPQMEKVYLRSESADRFHDSDTTNTIAHHLPKGNEADITNDITREYFQRFGTEKEIHEYSLNHQTMAMWLRFYNWSTRTFPSLFRRENLTLSAFELHNDKDFEYFLKTKLGNKYEKTFDKFNAARNDKSMKSLLEIYTREDCGFYQSLNLQLADSANEADTSPHLCDRFIIEFHIRSNELEKRAFLGIVYRGATMNLTDVSSYEKVLENKPRGVITFKAFSSTSKKKDMALDFIFRKPPEKHQAGVLFIIEIKSKSPTIVGIADASFFKKEEEILIMPGSLFVVTKIIKDVITHLDKKTLPVTEIYLEYLHMPVSFWKKLHHTYRSATKDGVT